MKRLFSIIVITFSATIASSCPIKADIYKVGDVFYCVSESGAFAERWSDYDLKIWETQKFSFKIENKSLAKFGEAGWLFKTEFRIDFLSDMGVLIADNDFGYLYMSDGRFNLSQSTGAGVYMVTGNCDKF